MCVVSTSVGCWVTSVWVRIFLTINLCFLVGKLGLRPKGEGNGKAGNERKPLGRKRSTQGLLFRPNGFLLVCCMMNEAT